MPVEALIYPVLVQVLLSFVLLLWMGSLRLSALSRREVRGKDIALGQPAWPNRPTQVANCFKNQFELPVLFYLVVVLVIITRTSNVAMVVLAWAFVATRLVHAMIHTGANDLSQRFFVFLAGALVLMAMWVLFTFRLIAGPL